MCEHTDFDGFACQECESCKRIENEESLDYMIVSNDRIKKKEYSGFTGIFLNQRVQENKMPESIF